MIERIIKELKKEDFYLYNKDPERFVYLSKTVTNFSLQCQSVSCSSCHLFIEEDSEKKTLGYGCLDSLFTRHMFDNNEARTRALVIFYKDLLSFQKFIQEEMEI